MRYLKMVGLLALAATALMVAAASASANPVLTYPSGTEYTGPLHAESEGHAVLHGSFGIEVQCNSTVGGEVEVNNTEEASGVISTLDFTNCTNGYEVHVGEAGSLAIEPSGTVFSNGAVVTVTVPIFGGIECIYETTETDVGNLTDSSETGGTATLDISASIPRTGGSGFCGSSGTWTGSYVVTEPDELFLN